MHLLLQLIGQLTGGFAGSRTYLCSLVIAAFGIYCGVTTGDWEKASLLLANSGAIASLRAALPRLHGVLSTAQMIAPFATAILRMPADQRAYWEQRLLQARALLEHLEKNLPTTPPAPSAGPGAPQAMNPTAVNKLLVVWAIAATAAAVYFREQAVKPRTLPQPQAPKWGQLQPFGCSCGPSCPCDPCPCPPTSPRTVLVTAGPPQDPLANGVDRRAPERPGTSEYGRPDPAPGGILDLRFLKEPADRAAAAVERTATTVESTLGGIRPDWGIAALAVLATAVVMNSVHSNNLARAKAPRAA